ncbi:MAG: glycyl-radical enzyme activating protein [Desulfotignum sp.]|nr:glycyl-radical enzyme activating protein [Desulfotignum sp.]
MDLIDGNPFEHITGLVSNIQKFSIHDGPGIRTTVFTKGCPLGCRWCSNPESIVPGPEIMTRFSDRCCHCNACMEMCRQGAIQVEYKEKCVVRYLDRDLCNHCMICVDGCPTGALERAGEFYTTAGIMEIIEQDLPFYETSDGGVTLSGGEPLLQPKFTRDVFRMCRQQGIHTALDTTGHADITVLDQVLPWCDLVLYDIKHMDAVIHHRWTGVKNTTILDNLRHIHTRVPVWIRVPLIPGFNDNAPAVKAIFRFVSTLTVQQVDILSYHQWSRSKYAGLGRPYPLEDADPIDEKTLAMVRRLAHEFRLGNVKITAG